MKSFVADGPPGRGRLLMLDLDGTLLDTRHDLATAVNAVRAGYGLRPLSVGTVTRYVGDGLAELVQRALPGRDDDWPEAVERCRRLYRRHMLDRTAPYPGVIAGLRRLKKAGYRLALVSNKPAAACRRLLRHFGLARLFDRIAGGDSTERRKPHPEPLRVTMRALGFRPAASWMIGDHRTDLETARRAGVRSVFLSRGMGRRGGQRSHRTFARFSELTDYFTRPHAAGKR
ncbi:MAG TPA: HAD-IA family hydrolase [Kiritimatiellia bacterium]|nr:HAD-IA family hydrolase [Kiritimatiellia bacterium]